MKLLLCTHNAHKIKELKALIAADAALSGNVEVLSLSDVGFEDDIVEDGTTFEENAIIKASVGAKLGYVTVADDSGIEVDALNGAPGVYSARFAGEICDDEANNALLLQKLDKVEKEDRTARYVSVISRWHEIHRSRHLRRGSAQRILRQRWLWLRSPLFRI